MIQLGYRSVSATGLRRCELANQIPTSRLTKSGTKRRNAASLVATRTSGSVRRNLGNRRKCLRTAAQSKALSM
jgi:hypothetical protein